MIGYILILISVISLFLFVRTKKITKKKKENLIYLVGFVSTGILGLSNLINSTNQINNFFKSESEKINVNIDSYNDSITFKTDLNKKPRKDFADSISSKKQSKLPLNIGGIMLVNNSIPKPDNDIWSFDEYGEIVYSRKVKSNEIYINPSFPYLDDFKNGLVRQYYFGDFGFVRFPTLDFKITNNSEETIFFNKVEFIIDKSEVDKTPFFVLWDVHEAEIGLQNQAWSELKNINISFNFYPADTKYENLNFHILKYKKDLSNLRFDSDGGMLINLKKELKREGINKDSLDLYISKHNSVNPYEYIYANMKHLKQKSKPENLENDECQIKIAGLIEFDNFFNGAFDRHYKKKFTINTTICQAGRGAGGDISDNYDVIFENKNKNYKIEKSISKVLKSGDIERFTFTIATTKSTIHKFKVRLYYNNDKKYIESKKINLNIFSPNYYWGNIQEQIK